MSCDQAAIGRKSRTKGAGGEREFCRLVSSLTDGRVNLRRNLTQSRDSGDDTSAFNFSIEIKRYQTARDAQVKQWWQQCQDNAAKQGKVPVLAFRADNQCWQILMHPTAFFAEDDIRGCIRMSIDLFCQWLLHPTAFHLEDRYHAPSS